MIECFFDCSSPWTWLGFRGLRRLSAELGQPVRWRPVLVGGVFNAVNPSVYASRLHGVPAKLAYQAKDLADWARRAGVHINWPPSVFPVNSVKAMRGCVWLLTSSPSPDGQATMAAFADAVFQAYWSDDLDISQDSVLMTICERVGIDPAAFLAAIQRPDIKAQLIANGDELIARGGFGSPTIFVAGSDMYFGNDRLPLVRDAVLRHTAAPG